MGCGERSCGRNSCELVFFVFTCHLIVIFMSSYKLTREVVMSEGGGGVEQKRCRDSKGSDDFEFTGVCHFSLYLTWMLQIPF